MDPQEKNPVEIPINGILDLHTFRPPEVNELVYDYLDACRRRGILSVRIIHGKGSGALKRTLHAALEKIKWVDSFYSASEVEGGWGATIVLLDSFKNREAIDKSA